MGQRVPILVYHHVYCDDDPRLVESERQKSTGTIGESEFRRHMTHIAGEGWTVVSTTQVLDWLERRGTLPKRSVVLHFDNGLLNTRTIAMPALSEIGMTATCYVISEATEAASAGRPAAIRTSQKPRITWTQAEELLEVGWEIGAHTATHPRLADLHAEHGDEAVLDEIGKSNKTYADKLGFVPAHFAYPSGSRSEETDALLAPHYRSLRLWHFSYPPVWRFTESNTSPHALECQNIDNTVSFESFARIFDEALES